MEELQLIQRIRQGDAAAINMLVDDYTSMLFHFSRNLVHNEELAEEIVYDSILQVIENIASGKIDTTNTPNLKSLLFSIVRNKSVNAYKSKIFKNKAEKEYYYHTSTSEENILDREVAQAYILDKLYREIEKLPAEEKDVFKLRWLEGLSPTQIAERKNLSISTIKNQLTKAMKTIRLGFTDDEWTVMLILFAAGSTVVN